MLRVPEDGPEPDRMFISIPPCKASSKQKQPYAELLSVMSEKTA